MERRLSERNGEVKHTKETKRKKCLLFGKAREGAEKGGATEVLEEGTGARDEEDEGPGWEEGDDPSSRAGRT